MKSLRSIFVILCLAVLFAAGALRAQTAPQPKYRSHFVVYNVQTKTTRTILVVDGEFHAPNWTPDGEFIVSDMGGELYRIPVNGNKAGQPEKIAVSQKMAATNDHALSWDGKLIAITGIVAMPQKPIRSAADIHNPIYIMNIDGSNAHDIHLGWLHGWSPDGQHVVYAQYNKDNFDLYRVNVDGSGEILLTANKAADDGPEYSADGKWIYFCSFRSGKWNGWRMPADGAGPDDKLAQQVTFGDTQDWFPHISPDGKWLYTISYPMDHPDHQYIGPGMKIKLLPLVNGLGAKGAMLKTVETFFGGQGSSNTGGWAPDSKRFAWTEYEKLPEVAVK